jgi:diguanylate cyclase (GGDEF)-like protein/PAS domain S-box-containing protein
LCAIVGRSEQELLQLRFLDITHPEDRAPGLAFLESAAAGSSPVYHVEKRYIHGDGRTVWVALTASVVSNAEGGAQHVIAQIEDISDRRALREDLAHRAGHDDLTGLPNRHTLLARLSEAVTNAQVSGRPGAVLFCDVDGFKLVNDTYGHAAGDRVLIVVAQRLAGASRRTDTVARLGGDEFVVVAEDTTPAKARQLAVRLRRAVAAPIVVDQTLLHLSVSIGVASLHDQQDPESILRRADASMYEDKDAGRNGNAVSSPRSGAGTGVSSLRSARSGLG